MLCAPLPRLETINLKIKKEDKLGMSGGGGERGEGAHACECVCVYTQVASRVLTHINFVSIFVRPVMKWGFSTSFHIWKQNMPKGSSLQEKKFLKKRKEKNNFYPLFRKMNQKERKKYVFKVSVLTQRHMKSFHLPLLQKWEKFIYLKLNEIHQH